MAESPEPETLAPIKQQVEELRCSNALLQTENEMCQSFLNRQDSLNQATQMEEGAVVDSEDSGSSEEPPTLLKPEQKYYIAACELEELRNELEQLNISLGIHPEYYKAALEDSDMRLAEIKRERHDFEQFVAKTQQTTRNPALRAQKVTEYIERNIKAKKARTERMQRRNAYLRTKTRKKKCVVHQKQYMFEMLSKVESEFQKLINILYREKVQVVQDQTRFKRILVHQSQQELNVYKERLSKEMKESKMLSMKIASLEEKLLKIRENQQRTEKNRAEAEAFNKKLIARLANFHVPDVMKYVEAKVTNDQLKQTVKVLERKARISEITSLTKKASPEESPRCSKSFDH